MGRYESTRRAGILGILGNFFLLLIKGFVGIVSNSQSMIADSANSASDIFASLMTFIGNKIASEPSDEGHNFGHGKAEYIFSFLISLSMLALAFKLLVDAINSLVFDNHMTFSWFLVIVCIITIVVKLALFLYTKKLANVHDSLLLQANMKDHRNDCIVTSFTLVSILFTIIHIYWIDGVVGIGISLWIAFTGMKIFTESYNILMDVSLDLDTNDLILDLAHNYKEIQKVDNMYSTPVGYQYVVVLTIYVDGNMSTFDSHQLADALEKDICAINKIYQAIIHVNPI